jgi:hypothetical protein
MAVQIFIFDLRSWIANASLRGRHGEFFSGRPYMACWNICNIHTRNSFPLREVVNTQQAGLPIFDSH